MKMMMKKSILGAAMAAGLGFGSTARADVIIDLFANIPSQEVATELTGTTVNNQAGPLPAAGTLGGWRDLSIQKTFDNVGNSFDGESRFAAGGGVLALDNATGNRSIGVVTWDGANDAGPNGTAVDIDGLNGANVAEGGADRFLADIIAADLGFDYRIRVWDMDGDTSELHAGVQFLVTPNMNNQSDFLFSWFNLANGSYCEGAPSGPPPVCADPFNELAFTINRTGGPIDFSRLGALQIEFTNPDTFGETNISADFAIGTIRTPGTVPEPGSLALGGLALLGAALSARRRRSGEA